MKIFLFLSYICLFFSACTTSASTVKVIGVQSENIITKYGDTIRLGGYGSAIAYDSKQDLYYLLTDRGPNTDFGENEAKLFPMPDYSPTVGVFKLEDDSLRLVRKINLKDSTGSPFLGLPNTQGDGVTGEIAYTPNGEQITGDYLGIDSEGLCLAPDGTFWVSDEYGPFILNFSMEGELLRTISPSNILPDYYANRRPNRGMEGLSISSDGERLYGIMQSPLYIPDSRTRNTSVNVRIIEITIKSGETREFIYQLEDSRNVISEILYLGNNSMLVLERDGKFPINGVGFKKIFRINISESSDISGMEIEMLNNTEFKTKNIIIADKELYIDILKTIPNYPHDKVEGMAFVSESELAIVNDDDFTLTDKNNTFITKLHPSGKEDHSTVYIIDINKLKLQ